MLAVIKVLNLNNKIDEMKVRVFHSFSFREALNASRFDCCWSCWCGPAASVSYGNGFRPDWLNKGGSMLEPIKYRW